ncbi:MULTISPECIES: HNH endonuclease family protein [Citrobacter]|uniref:hypothetical protein n=1 Tax=Citrobacter TaxID=544 RepID=UPI0006A9FFF9|nr:hypothetical protein [Citrobacter braakii]
MISFAYSFDKKFIKGIINDFFIPKSLNKADVVKRSCFLHDRRNYKNLCAILEQYSLQKIIFCKPQNFKNTSIKVFRDLPILADFYHPACIFKYAIVDDSILTLKGRAAQDAYTISYINVVLELKRMQVTYNSYRSGFLYNELISNPSVSTLKRIIRKVKLLKTVGCKLTKKQVSEYPEWVTLFQTIFDYKDLSKCFGYDIVKSSNLEVCPYCNAEDIRLIEGEKKHRPDIDHFLPQSKYPFFATSLYNFVPAGAACNRSFKRDVDLINGYIHPLLQGIEKIRLFDFSYIDVEGKVNIELNDIPAFNSNVKLFELHAVYKHRKYYQRYSELRNIYQEMLLILAQGDISRKKGLMETFFHTSKSYRVMKDKKFEAEALDHIIEKFELVSQQLGRS